MYCLDKLQRELAYFFSKDIRELPKVESLLAEAGYTQIRKGDEIIEIDSALGRHSADLGDSRAVITDKVTPTLESPKNHESPTATPRILEREAAQSTDSTSQNKRSGASVAQQVSLEILESQSGITKQAQSPTASPRILERESTQAPKVDSSVETKELHTKTTSKLTKDELDNLPVATAQEYGEFLEKIAQKDYQNTPEILKIATLNNDLQELINNNHSASVFITRARAGHISEARKGEYDQALTLDGAKANPSRDSPSKTSLHR